MLQSKVLSSYSPIIIPVSFIFGLNFIEKDLLFEKFSPLGITLFIISFLLFLDRVEDAKDRTNLNVGSGLFIFSYILFRYFPSLYKISLSIMLISLILIGQGLVEYDIYNTDVQQIYLSLFIIFIYFISVMPYNNNIDSLSLIIPSIFFTIIVLKSINID